MKCLSKTIMFVAINISLLRRTAVAWMPLAGRSFHRTTLTILRNTEIDEFGRRVRKGRSKDTTGWDDFDPIAPKTPSIRTSWEDDDGGWDDFDPSPSQRRSSPSRTRADRRSSPPRGRVERRRSPGGTRAMSRNNPREKKDTERKINMKAIEGAGFVHLYGLSSVLNALQANRRDFTRPEDLIDLEELEGEELEHEVKQRERKPEAQFSPWLFVQEQKGKRGRSFDKAAQAEQAEELAERRGIPVAYVDKGVLNTLSGNRPHQGYVLRCGKLFFESISRIPHPNEDPEAPSLWLVLDEVVDPHNLGALLRSSYFLGSQRIGVLVCAKNSAPPSPTVSAASAGALELIDVYSTSNLPRTLATAESDGFRIVGASSYVPKDLDVPLYDLQDLPKEDTPALLVLGSEGHGLRSLVAKSCTEFVRIPGASDSEGVDSLNVSVTGGILLWHLLQTPSM